MTSTSRKIRFLIMTLVGCAMAFLAVFPTSVTAGGISAGLASGFHTSVASCGQVRSLTDRRTADGLLKRARIALEEGNLELADWYVSRAEGMEVVYDSVFEKFVDTPEKVRQAMSEYRAKVPPPIDTEAATAAAMNAASEKIVDSAKHQATNFLSNGRAALASGDIDKAIGWYQSAVATGAKFNDAEYSPKAMADALKAYGVDAEKITGAPATRIPAAEMVDAIATAALTDPAAQNGTNLNHNVGRTTINSNTLLERANKISATANNRRFTEQRDTTLRLLAQAEVALDRGDIPLAEQLALRAQEINLPENQFKTGDTRPWMTLMQIRRQRGRVQAQPQPTAHVTSNVAPAPPGMAAVAKPVPVAVDPLIQQTRNALVSAELPLATPTNTPPTNALAQNIVPPASAFSDAVNSPILTSPMLGGGAPIVTPSTSPATQPTLPPAGIPPTSILPEPTPTPASVSNDLVNDLMGDPTPLAPVAKVPSQPAPVSTAQLQPTPSAPSLVESEVIEYPAVSEGQQLVLDGEAALKKHDSARARALFREAWAFENTLDESTRQRLQDYLQSMPAANPNPEPPALLAERATPKPAAATPPSGPSQEAQRKVRALIDEMSRQQASINAIRESDPQKAWEQIKVLRKTVVDSDVDKQTRDRLTSRVDRAMKDMETYIDANRSRIENDARNREVIAEVDRRRDQRVEDEHQLAEFVEQFNDLIDQQRFSEASIVAKRAAELTPHEPVVQTMLWKSQIARQVASTIQRNQVSSENISAMLQNINESNIPMQGEIEFPTATEWADLSRSRLRAEEQTGRKMTDADMKIKRALQKDVDVNFVNQPISVVLEKLSQIAGVNVFLDPEGLTAEGVTSDTTVTLNLRTPISLQSALNLILSPLHLSYIVQDEVLRITSEQVRDGDVYTVPYNVADLVIQIPNSNSASEMGLQAAMRDGYRMANEASRARYQGGGGYNRIPYVLGDNDSSSSSGNESVLAQMGLGGGGTGVPVNMGGMMGGAGAFGPQGGAGGGAAMADFDTLIELVTTTVAPETWEEVGGTGSIAGFPTNLSLVVAQTQEVHEKIVDLLAQLRRLQDLQVTIEVRFITLNDDFFERMGVDFDFDIDDNTNLSQQDLANQGQAGGFMDDDGPSVTVGIDPVLGTPTVDLDVGFSQGSFAAAVPAFGGFDAATAASVGFAILSDIEAFFVIEAAQGDTRTNVLQAPKVTLFNGQFANISDISSRPFVTSIIPVVGDFAAAHQPVITVLNEGTQLSVQAVVSQDRRFVRLTLVPFFSRIGNVDTFTFDGADNSDTGTNVIDPTDDTNTVLNNQLRNTAGTTVQLPTLASTSVQTTVSVPDGGTILLGGIKRLTEGRTERGVPMLSKLPYINRLFRNVGIGRETESLMMMVTPRIIIQEEEEAKLGISGGP